MAEEIIEPIAPPIEEVIIEEVGPDKPPKKRASAQQTPSVTSFADLDLVLRDRKNTLQEIEDTKITLPWKIVKGLGLNMIPVPKLRDIDNPRFAENEYNKALSDKILKETESRYQPFMEKLSANVLGAKGEKASQYITTDVSGNKQVDLEKLEKIVDQQNALYKGGAFSKSYLRQDLSNRVYDYMLKPDVEFTAQKKLQSLGLRTPQQQKEGAMKIVSPIYSNGAMQAKIAVSAKDKKVKKLGAAYKQTASELNELAKAKMEEYQFRYYNNEYERINSLYTQYITELDYTAQAGQLTPEQLQQEKQQAQRMLNESLSATATDANKYALEQFNQHDKEGYDEAMADAYSDYTTRVKDEDKKTKTILQRIQGETEQKARLELDKYGKQVDATVARVYKEAWNEVSGNRRAKDEQYRALVQSFSPPTPGGNLVPYARLFGNAFTESLGGMTANLGKYFESAGMSGRLTDWMIGKGSALEQDFHIYKPEISWQNFWNPSFIAQAVGSAAATTLPAMAVGAITKNPNLTATIATGLEAAANGGETYSQAIGQGMDPAEASLAADNAAKWSVASFPAQLLESKLFIKALGGSGEGARKIAGEIALSGGANAVEETVQTIGQIKALDPTRATADILLNDPTVRVAAAEGALAGGILQAGSTAIGGAVSNIANSGAVKGQQSQWLADIIAKHGANRAKAITEYYYNNNELTDEQKEELMQKIDGIATKQQEANALGLTVQQTQAVVGLSDDIEEQQAIVNNTTSPELKKAAEKKLADQQKQLDEVVAGTIPLATLSMANGTELTVLADEATDILNDPEVQEAVKEGAITIATEDSKIAKTVEKLQAAATEQTPVTDETEADLTDAETTLLTTIQANLDKIGGAYGTAISERIEDPFEQRGIIDAVVSQIQDSPAAAVDLFGKEVVDAAYGVIDDQQAISSPKIEQDEKAKGIEAQTEGLLNQEEAATAVAPLSQENISEAINIQEDATTNIGEERSTEQHPGAVSGQPEVGEREGSERQAAEPVADNSDVTSDSQRTKQEIADFELLRKSAVDSELIEGVQPHMLAARKNHKILNAIVGLIPVDVMNILIRRKGTSQKGLHDQSVLSDGVKAIIKNDISGAASDAVAFGIARMRAKLLSSLAGGNPKFNSAELALIKDRESFALLMGFGPIPETSTYLPRIDTNTLPATALSSMLSMGLDSKGRITNDTDFLNKLHDVILQKNKYVSKEENAEVTRQARRDFLHQFDNNNPKSDFSIVTNLSEKGAKIRKLDAMSRKLMRAKQEGIITENDFDQLSERVDKLYSTLGASQKVSSQGELIEVENQVREAVTKELGEITPTEKISNKEKAQKIATNIRKLKRGNKEFYGGFLGIGVAVYDGLLETAATVIEAGGSIADAIQAAVEYLKPHLEGEKHKDSEIKKAVEAEFENIGLIQKSAAPIPIKQSIKKTTDTSMQEKVTVKESTILKDTFKRIERISKDVFRAGAIAGFEKGKDKGVQQGYGFGVAEGKVIGAMEQGKQGKGTRSLKDALSDYLKETEKAGQLSVRQIKAILNKAGNIQTENSLYNFLGYVQKVLANADYQTQLQEAQGIRAKLRKANKSKAFERSAVNKALFSAFLRINPEYVQDIQEYNDIANKILANATGVQIKLEEGDGTVKNESYQINNNAIEDYIEAHQEYAEKMAKERLLEVYKDLADIGVIDASSMSLKEMKEIIDAINGTDPNASEQVMEAFAKQEEKKKTFISLLDYQKQALRDWNQTQEYLELTPEQRQIVNNLDSIDTSQLSLKQMAKLNDVINNIVVNSNFVGSGNISILSQVQKNLSILIDKIKASGIELGSITNPIIQGLSSINLMTEFIAKSTKVAAEIQRYTSISGLFDGHARAKNVHGTALKKYTDLKGNMGGDIDNALNRFKRGVYARIIQHFGGTKEDQQQEFERVKNQVRQTADRLLSSEEQAEVREGQLIDQVYNSLLEGTSSVEEVTSRMDDNNKRLVEFWRSKFTEHLARVRESAELYDNQLFEEVENYTATKRRGLGGKPVANEDFNLFKENYFNKGLDNKAATTKLKRSRSRNLMQGTVLDFDFDSVQSRAFYETLYDVDTSKERSAINMLFDSDQAKQVFGNNKNSKTVSESLSKAVKMQRGKQPPLEALDKAVTDVAKHLQAKSVRMALASISQIPKQYISVAFNTLANLGMDIPLFFKALNVSNNIELFNQFNIGARGHTQAGYNKDVDLETIERTNFGNDVKKAASWVAETGKTIAEKLMTPLVASDVAVARTSWLAYYMQDLKRRGIDISNRDWKNEHLAPDYEAAAYAEQMVSRSQVANDVTAQGNLYKDKRGIKGLAVNALLPFSTFATNQRLRMTNDMQKILFGGEKKEALKSLAGTAAEQAVFNAIKIYALGWLTTQGAHAVAGAFGLWGGDDEKEYEEKQKVKIKIGDSDINTSAATKKFFANTFSDYFFSGMGTAPQTWLNKGMNALYGTVADEETASGKVIEDPKLFYIYDPTKDAKPDYGSWGLYGLPLAKATELVQSFEPAVLGKTDLVTKGGVKDPQTEKVNLTDKEQAAYLTAFIVDATALIGVSDEFVSSTTNKFKRIIENQRAKKYGRDFTMQGKAKGTESPGSGPKPKGIKTGLKTKGLRAK